MEREYAAFISYRHKPLDMAVARRLHQLIERYRPPKALRRGGRKGLGLAFRDQEELPVSGDLSADIRRALDHSEFLIVVCTPDTPESVWVGREIAYFTSRHDRGHVLAVLAAGEPEQSFPYALTHIGGDEIVEPLAADVRADSTRASLRLLRGQSLRLFAAMLGCPYDHLVRRTLRRRRRRALAALAAAFCVLCGYAAMLLYNNVMISRKNAQLEAANDTLTRQKTELQMRESRLLTEEARRESASTDSLRAVLAVADALPRADDPRPYYGPAEAQLMSALNALEGAGEAAFLNSREIALTAPVSRVACTSDGARVLALDEQLRLTAYDAATGGALWQAELSGSNFLGETRLLLDEAAGCVLALTRGTLWCVSLADGSTPWLCENAERVALSSDGRYAAVFRRSMNSLLDMRFITQLTVIDVGAAAVSQRFEFPEEYQQISFSNFACESGECDLVFSEKDDFLCGLFRWQDAEGGAGNRECLWMADLETGEISTVFSREADTSYAVWMHAKREGGRKTPTFYIAELVPETGAPALYKLSGATGKTQWRREAKAPDGAGMNWYVRHTAQRSGSLLWIGCGENLYALVLGDADSPGGCGLGSPICCLIPQEDGYVAVVTEDGLYRLAWISRYFGISDSVRWNGRGYRLGKCAQCVAVRDGFFRLKGDAMEIASRGEGGFLAVVPAENSRKIVLTDASVYVRPAVRALTALPEDERLRWKQNMLLRASAGRMILAASRSGNGQSEALCLYAVDLADGTAETVEIPRAEQLSLQLLPLPDGAGCMLINLDDWGSVSLYAGGEMRALARCEQVELDRTDSLVYVDQDGLAAMNLLRDGRTVLTAQCDGKTLRRWRNDAELPALPLPEGTVWGASNTRKFVGRVLAVGENGCVLVNSYDAGRRTVDRYLLCDADGAWHAFDSVGGGGAEPLTALGQCEAVFAALEEEGTLAVYGRGAPLALKTDTREAAGLCFAAEDSLLALCAGDGYYEVFDAVTGDRLYAGRLNTGNTACTGIAAEIDRAEERLYVFEAASRAGQCLSMRDWSCLGDIGGLCGFLPDTGEALLWDAANYTLYARRVPTLAEMLEAAQNLQQ